MTNTKILERLGRGPLRLRDQVDVTTSPYDDAVVEPEVLWGENGIDAMNWSDGHIYAMPRLVGGSA